MEKYVMALVEEKYADPFILPLQIIPEIAKIEGREYDKALSAYNYLIKNINYESIHPLQRNSLEVFNEKKGNCIEQSFLYVAIARFLGLDSKIVLVSENHVGDMVSHACASVIIDGSPILIDPAYRKFSVSHRKYQILEDDMVRELRKGYTPDKKFNRSTPFCYNLGDLVQYLYDFEFMNYGFSQKGCFYDNLDILQSCMNDMGIGQTAISLFSIERKEKIKEALLCIEQTITQKAEDKKSYEIGKKARCIKDAGETKKFTDAKWAFLSLRKELPSIMESYYDIGMDAEIVLALKSENYTRFSELSSIYCSCTDRFFINTIKERMELKTLIPVVS